MPVFDIDPGTNPKARGTMSFFVEGADPATGFQVTSEGELSIPGGQNVGGDLAVTGGLDVDGYTALQAGQYDGQLTLWSGDPATLRFGTAGGGLAVAEGVNATMGLVTLTAGTATVATDKVTANSRIFLTAQTAGGAPGALYVSARTAGASFTVTSTSGTDTSSVAWWIVEPA